MPGRPAVRRLAAQLDRAQPPARTRASAASALASIAALPGLRRDTAQGQASPLAVTSRYTTAITGLFPVVDGIADLSDNPVLITSVRALGSLARLKDQAAQQQAILGPALAAGRFEPGALMALTAAQAQEASDVATFRGSATAEESWALARTLAGPQARQASAVEQRVTAAGDGALALDPQAPPAVAARHLLHGRLAAARRAAAHRLDHGRRPESAAERETGPRCSPAAWRWPGCS